MIKLLERTLELLRRLKSTYAKTLGQNLVGIYLHGSYVLGSYQEQVSDLDYIVVVKRPLKLAEKQALMTQTLTKLWPLAPAKGLEFHVLLLADTLHFQQPLPFDCHFSKMHYAEYLARPQAYLAQMHGTDPDLAAHLTILTTTGQVLLGPAIANVFAPVPSADYWASLVFDIADARQTIHESPTYTVLNLCRVLAYRTDGLILSKAGGGQWGLMHLQRQYWPVMQHALTAYQSPATKQPKYDQAQLTAFASGMLAKIGITESLT